MKALFIDGFRVRYFCVGAYERRSEVYKRYARSWVWELMLRVTSFSGLGGAEKPVLDC